MSPKKRIYKHDLKEDHFVTATVRISTYIRKRQTFFLAIAGGIALVAIVAVLFSSSHKHSQQKATELLGQADMLYRQGAYAQVIERCQELLDQFKSSDQAEMAAIFLADSHLNLGHYQESIEANRLYIDKYHRDKTMTAAAYTGMAICYEQMERFSDAGEHHLQAAQKYPQFYGAPQALMDAARCFKRAGEKAKAKDAYDLIIREYPESRLVEEARMLSAELAALS